MEKVIRTGIFNLNGCNVEYTLTNNKFEGVTPIAHCGFNSLIKGKPNALTSTGYFSYFIGIVKDGSEIINLIANHPEKVVTQIVHTLATSKEKGFKIRNLDFEQRPELEPIHAVQKSLF